MIRGLVGVSVLLLFVPNPLFPQGDAEFGAIQRRITDIYSDNSTGVFRVLAAHRTYDEKGDLQNALKSGTGCFISREGHILANASVVMNSNRSWIDYRGVNYAAELVGVEPSTNLALLKASTLPGDFSFFIPEANHQLPQIGSMVVVISCPLNFDPSPSLTMVAGDETSFAQRDFATTYIRVNKPVNLGEGGAPVIDLNGRFLGILVASAPDVGSGYVLPARAVLRVRDDLLFAGKFIKGWIGIEIGVRSTIREGRQIYLTEIVPNSPAHIVDMRTGDVLVRMGDFPIHSISDVRNAMFFARAGQFLDIQIFRNGVSQDVTVKVTERPEEAPPTLEAQTPVDQVDQVDPDSQETSAPREAPS